MDRPGKLSRSKGKLLRSRSKLCESAPELTTAKTNFFGRLHERRLRKDRQAKSDTTLPDVRVFVDEHGGEYSPQKKFASGSSAEIYDTDSDDDEMVIKLLSDLDSLEGKKDFVTEIEILEEIDSPRIVEYFGTLSDPLQNRQVGILLGKCTYGDLHKYMLSQIDTQQDTKVVIQWLKDGFAAVTYLHSKEIIHRDIKSPNFLVDSDLRLKLADFGLARKDTPENRVNTLKQLRTSFCWTAPEMLTRDEENPTNTFASDVYASTIVIWEVVYFYYHRRYKKPFTAQNPFFVLGLIGQGKRPEMDESFTTEWKDYLEQGWHQEPDKRPNASEMLGKLDGMTLETEQKLTVTELLSFWEEITGSKDLSDRSS